MNLPSTDAGQVRRLFDRVCDLSTSERRAVFDVEGTSAALVAEIEDLLQCDATAPSGPRIPLAHILAALPETEIDAGERLGAWRLVRRLAKGGMGAVFLAERADGHFEQQAAIKLIRGLPGVDTLSDFARERQMLARLQHPHIARLLDGGATPGGQPYLVMEYVEGEPIDAYCERRALALDARLRLFQDVCRAVQFAHQHLIVHCDLKPSNVLVREDGTPVLLDFGIARVIDRQRTTDALAAASRGSGHYTPGYASPEQMSGEPVTTASDVYALGLILFELVTGRKARIDTGDPTIGLLGDARLQPSRVVDNVPWRRGVAGDIDAIVLRATAAQPHLRYSAASMLADDIQRHRENRPVSARPPTPGYRASRLLRRRWPLFLAMAFVAVLIIAFTWRLALERDRALGAEREAQVQAATAVRVGDFLTSVFNVSNPRSGHRRDISARDVLDEGASRIEHELADEPRVKARLTDTLATAYRFIGEPARSVDLFQSSIDLYLDPRVDDPLAAARALSQLAVGYANNTYPLALADAAARRSLALREQHGANALDLADAYNSLGIVLEQEDKFADAEAALQEGLRLRRANGADASTVATSLHNLALVANGRGDNAVSIRLFEDALALRRAAVGEHHRDYQSTLAGYGIALGRAGDAAKARPVLEQNVALAHELYGDDSINTGIAQDELGSVLQDLGRYRDAVTHYEAAVRIVETVGDADANLAMPLNNLASVLEDMGDLSRAIPLLRRSLKIRSEHLPSDDVRVTRARYNLGRALTRAGSLDEAKVLLGDALKQWIARRGESDPATFKARLWLGELERRAGHAERASQTLAQLVASSASLTPQLRAQRATFAAELAATHGDDSTSLARRKEAWELLRGSLGEGHPLTAANAVGYAVALDDQGRHVEAERIANSAMPVIDAELAPDAPARSLLARWRAPPSVHR